MQEYRLHARKFTCSGEYMGSEMLEMSQGFHRYPYLHDQTKLSQDIGSSTQEYSVHAHFVLRRQYVLQDVGDVARIPYIPLLPDQTPLSQDMGPSTQEYSVHAC